MLSMLGIRQIVVVINKMDLVGYDQQRFQAIQQEYAAFLRQITLAGRLHPGQRTRRDSSAALLPAPVQS